jgi:hypothetical protein
MGARYKIFWSAFHPENNYIYTEVKLDKVKVLEQYLPPHAAPLIGRWIDYFKCEFKISRNRNSKFGDYRAPTRARATAYLLITI